MMQSYTLDSLNLYYEKNCKDRCTGNKVETHKGNHESLSYSTLAQMINMFVFSDDPPQIKHFVNEITQILTSIREMADNSLKQLKSQMNRYKLKTVFNLKTDDSINACLLLASGKIDEISKVRCCELSDIFYKINFMDPSQLIFTNKSAIQISQKITSKISEQINKYNSFFKKFRPQQQSSKSNIKKQEQKHEHYLYSSDDQKQCRPTRLAQYHRREKATSKQKTEDGTKKTQGNKRVKVADLKNAGTDQKFSISLKVIRIIKQFNIKNTRKIEFVGGDETGIANCVMTEKPNIAVKKTIDVTDCRVYNFKGRIKQIQSTAESRLYQGSDIKFVNYEFHLSKNPNNSDYQLPRQHTHKRDVQANRQNQQFKSQTKASSTTPSNTPAEKQGNKKLNKISEIEPDSEGLNIIAQVYKVMGQEDDIIDCYIGDETGIVRAHLPRSLNFIREGCSVKLGSIQANVVDGHIILKLSPQSKIEPINITFALVRITNDMSAEEWAEASNEEDDQINDD